VRQSAGVSVDPNGACRGGSGGAAGRGASRWPSRPAGRSPAGRPAAARTGSPRGIPRAATTRIESTRWRRDRPEVSASMWNRGNEKAPRRRETLRVGGPVWAHSDDYSPTLSIGQAIGQVSWSPVLHHQWSLPNPVNPAGGDHRWLARPTLGAAFPSRHERPAGKYVSRWSALGPWGIGNRWFSAGTSGQRRRISIAGQRPFTVSTLDGEAARRWVRIPPPPSVLPAQQ
jgi:hypothetical protein